MDAPPWEFRQPGHHGPARATTKRQPLPYPRKHMGPRRAEFASSDHRTRPKHASLAGPEHPGPTGFWHVHPHVGEEGRGRRGEDRVRSSRVRTAKRGVNGPGPRVGLCGGFGLCRGGPPPPPPPPLNWFGAGCGVDARDFQVPRHAPIPLLIPVMPTPALIVSGMNEVPRRQQEFAGPAPGIVVKAPRRPQRKRSTIGRPTILTRSPAATPKEKQRPPPYQLPLKHHCRNQIVSDYRRPMRCEQKSFEERPARLPARLPSRDLGDASSPPTGPPIGDRGNMHGLQ